MLTDDVSLQVFMEHLKKLSVSSQAWSLLLLTNYFGDFESFTKIQLLFYYSKSWKIILTPWTNNATMDGGRLDVTFLVFWFNDFYLRLRYILCGITSSLRMRKNFFDFPWNKLVRQHFRFHVYKCIKKKSTLGEDWTHNLESQNQLLYQLSHHVYWYQLPFHTSFYMWYKIEKVANKFISRIKKKNLPYP